MFSGLQYLWAGRSVFGFDNSGLTSLDLRAHGVIIPRDAEAQAVKGRAVSSGALRPGDLLFYATRGHVHHVSIYAGNRPHGAVPENRQHGPDDRHVFPVVRSRVRRRTARDRLISNRR
ncbi:MAG: C40 family peptidase [Dermatophilaceae bacterium]